jgi:hypothetical protein
LGIYDFINLRLNALLYPDLTEKSGESSSAGHSPGRKSFGVRKRCLVILQKVHSFFPNDALLSIMLQKLHHNSGEILVSAENS